MKAVYAERPCPDDPLAVLRFGERPEPEPPDEDWTVVTVRSAGLNHHDLWTLRGSGVPAHRYPLTLGVECAGTDESGRPVIVHGMVYGREFLGHPVRDPEWTMLGEGRPGTFAERVAVPRHTLIPKPPQLSFAEAGAITGTWLTAYRMLFTRAGLLPGQTVLVQGSGGGLSTALIRLGRAAGLRIWATSRDEWKRELATELGADQVFAAGAPLPERVDAVMESVGRETWAHSLRSVRAGGCVVVAGATTGALPPAHLTRIFWNELRVLGVMCGTMEELRGLLTFMVAHGLRPYIHREFPAEHGVEGFRLLARGQIGGKIVLNW
ncbi:zinc-binding dehydrogenase [Streptomyces sp. N50]|uniref:zinc-binding dehydrogenase n=1 Tax=Streptomyces sp. N50 TaxID=3081765 RepID=UPI0029623FEC|nr:zinc-binding dehydrogenase [Streptomyces sp. N50]WOX17134.1 zinc-binding dehydrogenase [Streptomyces sp. N50]